MASIEITAHDLVVRVHGVDRVLALRSSVTVPLAHVAGVREHAEEANYDDAVKDSGDRCRNSNCFADWTALPSGRPCRASLR